MECSKQIGFVKEGTRGDLGKWDTYAIYDAGIGLLQLRHRLTYSRDERRLTGDSSSDSDPFQFERNRNIHQLNGQAPAEPFQSTRSVGVTQIDQFEEFFFGGL